ncbi:hypothetical protein [Halobacteriovorax sp. HLS]|uniref:hypothetical protein n=1 Tax=Halobacteriovorax sp. HLS TaxID=2234000 RepID=UPI000FDB60BC|nr:hypothetical protein [Halobacteriovorax sp. HLS]
MKRLLFLCLITLISCSKKNELSRQESRENQPESITTKNEGPSSNVSRFPVLSLGLEPSINLELIGSTNGKVLNKELNLKPRNFIRSKMERILFNKSSEVIKLEDLFKFEYFLETRDRVKLFEGLSFSDVTEYIVSASTRFKVSSNQKQGVVRDISYKFSYFDGNRDAEISSVYEDLIRYENENEIIDLTSVQKREYSFLSSRSSFSELVNIFITGKSLLYEIVDYEHDKRSLRDWILKESSTSSHLLISTKKETLHFKILNGETIREAIQRQAKSYEISQNNNIKEINGNKGEFLVLDKVDIDRELEAGDIFSIYLNEQSSVPSFGSFAIYQEGDSLEVSGFQKKTGTLEFYIELSRKSYSLSHENYSLPVRAKFLSGCNQHGENCISSAPLQSQPRTCEIEASSLIGTEFVQISENQKDYININLDGHSHSLNDLIEKDMVTVNQSYGVLHIILNNFNSLNDYREVTISTTSDLKVAQEYRRSKNCFLFDWIRQMGPGENNYGRQLDYIEGFNAMERDVMIGEDFRMNVLSIK